MIGVLVSIPLFQVLNFFWSRDDLCVCEYSFVSGFKIFLL